MVTIGYGVTDSDGRVKVWRSAKNEEVSVVESGKYTLVFETDEYHARNQVESFFPIVEVTFFIKEGEKVHVPLLLSPFSYSTYRGS